MKMSLIKRFVAAVLAVVLVQTCIPSVVYAESTSVGTVIGPEETVRIYDGNASERERNFNSGWKFYLGDNSSAHNKNFDDSGWQSVTLPHDFSIIQGFTTSAEAESGFLPGGTGWYRKSFVLSSEDAGKTLILNFDGVYSHAYVYVNGTYIGEHHYGYTSFAFDISDYVICDGSTENVVAVKAVNNVPSSRWYSGSGIYRDVTLIATNPVHVGYNGVFVTTPNISKGNGTVHAEVELTNDSNTSARVTVKNTVYNADGVSISNTAESTVTIGAGATVTAAADPVASNPKLWSIDSPVLHTLRTEVYVNGTLTDTVETTFGFRWFEFKSDTGFYLNGVNMKLFGVCMHHDQGAAGSAAYYDAMYRQLAKMKEMGVNAIRTSHNPADEHFIDICNKLGLVVIEEAFDGWAYPKNNNSNDFSGYFKTKLSSSNQIIGGDSSMTWAEFAIKSMVKRDRNDPSVIMWSLANELSAGASTDSSYPNIARQLIGWIHELDTTRPTTIGENKSPSDTSTIFGEILQIIRDNDGVAGFNYAEHKNGEFEKLHKAWGKIYSSETASAVTSRGVYSRYDGTHDGKYHLTSYDNSTVSWGSTAHASIYNTLIADYIAGEFVWTGWDYIGEPTPWNGTSTGTVSGSGAIPNSSYFGIVDTAGFEKDNFYLFRSQWKQDDTTLHLVTAWDSDNYYVSGGKTPVVIYSNAPKVELYRNGTKIGTATRVEHTTGAGNKYYTYNVVSNNASICNAVSASEGASLYATFNVTYQAGTISAVAYDSNGKKITDTVGNSTVNTPGTVTKLEITQNKTVIDADGQSLVYIEVEVQDANGNLDTTASNTINFSLSGNGVILGVDNGDQATTEKFQQSSVLTSSTSAKIKAYAGKAVVIVRSTEEPGNITVNVTSSGLTGGSAKVKTTAVEEAVTEGMVSYTMVRDYSVMAGTMPQLQTTAIGTMADGSVINGTITWDKIDEGTYGAAGDYTITGTLKFAGEEAIAVTAKLHVVTNVIALRNIATVTTPNIVPDLPSTVRGVLPDGTLSGEFEVAWDSIEASDFATVGDIITVEGRATIIGDVTLPVTCTIRVGQAINTQSYNVAPEVISLTQDIPDGKTSDSLGSIINGTYNNSSSTSQRWTNYNYRKERDTAALTFNWHTAQVLSHVNLYHYYDTTSAALPKEVSFEFSLNGIDYETVGYTVEILQTTDRWAKYVYTFDRVINPVFLRINLTQQGGTTGGKCVGLTEVEIMTFVGEVAYNNSADLSGILIDGVPVENFGANNLNYTAVGAEVTAITTVNAGITILPADANGVVRILTVSEDGSVEKTYTVVLESSCAHKKTEIVGAQTPTCTEAGYTGDTVCSDCESVIENGSEIPAIGHINTEIRNAKTASCTEKGYTGDTFCLDCGTVIQTGSVIPMANHRTILQGAKVATCTGEGYTGDLVCMVCDKVVTTGHVIAKTDHKWDNGVVTKPATGVEEGVKIFTCTVCGTTRKETIEIAKKTPTVKLIAARGSDGKISLTGIFEDFENMDDYFEVTDHGFVYMTSTRLGAKSLTVNLSGRTKVTCLNYRDDGSFVYGMSPKDESTVYVVRAYLCYTDADGKSYYIYSAPLYVSYNRLTTPMTSL